MGFKQQPPQPGIAALSVAPFYQTVSPVPVAGLLRDLLSFQGLLAYTTQNGAGLGKWGSASPENQFIGTASGALWGLPRPSSTAFHVTFHPLLDTGFWSAPSMAWSSFSWGDFWGTLCKPTSWWLPQSGSVLPDLAECVGFLRGKHRWKIKKAEARLGEGACSAELTLLGGGEERAGVRGPQGAAGGPTGIS